MNNAHYRQYERNEHNALVLSLARPPPRRSPPAAHTQRTRNVHRTSFRTSSHGMALLITILVVGEYLVPCVNCYVQVVAVPLTGYLLRVQLTSFLLYPVLTKFSKWRVHYLSYVLLLLHDST
eukprot:11526-Heterococcus_DN1.PRE.3